MTSIQQKRKTYPITESLRAHYSNVDQSFTIERRPSGSNNYRKLMHLDADSARILAEIMRQCYEDKKPPRFRQPPLIDSDNQIEDIRAQITAMRFRYQEIKERIDAHDAEGHRKSIAIQGIQSTHRKIENRLDAMAKKLDFIFSQGKGGF